MMRASRAGQGERREDLDEMQPVACVPRGRGDTGGRRAVRGSATRAPAGRARPCRGSPVERRRPACRSARRRRGRRAASPCRWRPASAGPSATSTKSWSLRSLPTMRAASPKAGQMPAPRSTHQPARPRTRRRDDARPGPCRPQAESNPTNASRMESASSGQRGTLTMEPPRVLRWDTRLLLSLASVRFCRSSERGGMHVQANDRAAGGAGRAGVGGAAATGGGRDRR